TLTLSHLMATEEHIEMQRRSAFYSVSQFRPPTYPLFPYTTLFRSTAVLTTAGLAAGVAFLMSSGSFYFLSGQFPDLPLAEYSRRSEEHTSELQSPYELVCRLLLEQKKLSIIVAAFNFIAGW